MSFETETKTCAAYFTVNPTVLLIQPSSGDEEQFLEEEISGIASLANRDFAFVSFHIDDWNKELSPWCASPVFGKESFGDGASQTLRHVTDELIPSAKKILKLSDTIPVVLGGYSLAGLFSLWSAYNSSAFDSVCGISPSVWFEGWKDYASKNKPLCQKVYLSLGNKEEKTKNKIMASVGDNIRYQYDLLKAEDIFSTLEWNEGGHFNDPAGRCAKGFAWCLNNED
ncbi:MAG: esterase [Lachnospiraceae bacterium]|nr:esterase [Lachnospiraceae bacterium]